MSSKTLIQWAANSREQSRVLTQINRENDSLNLRRELRSLYQRQDPKRLTKYSQKVYSQNGEDGILREILNRIGTINQYFVEFGSGDGSENNTVYLLKVQGWSGLWMDGDKSAIDRAKRSFSKEIEANQLVAEVEFITAENVEELFKRYSVPNEFDVLSIDIDHNDYHVWKAIKYNPRVLVVEYNAIFQPGMDWVVEYQADAVWDRTSHFGASLSAFERLGREKGYSLVGCDFAGVNAFFVRDDLLGDKFCYPYTAENHFEPPRYGDAIWGGHRRRP